MNTDLIEIIIRVITDILAGFGFKYIVERLMEWLK